MLASQRICSRIAIQEVKTAIQNGWNFTQETTLSGRRTLQTILAARQKDYQIRLYYIGISSAEESLYRIANRVRKGGHNIAEADVRRRYEKRFADLSKILPYCMMRSGNHDQFKIFIRLYQWYLI